MFRIKKGIIIYDKTILANCPENRAGMPGFVPAGAYDWILNRCYPYNVSHGIQMMM